MPMQHPTRCIEAPPQPIVGFEVEDVGLPAERVDVPLDARERAALLIVGISQLLIPEDLAGDPPACVLEAYCAPLVREEALAHVDLLLEALAPRRPA